MGSVTVIVILLVSLVQFQAILCKPFLFDFLCDLVCDDDDNTTASSSGDDFFGIGDLCSCPTPAPPTAGAQGKPPTVDLNLPGLSVQMSNTNGQWSLNVNSNPSTPANSVIPLPSGGPPVSVGPGTPGGPATAAGAPPPAAGPAPTGAAAPPATPAAATTAAPSSAAPA